MIINEIEKEKKEQSQFENEMLIFLESQFKIFMSILFYSIWVVILMKILLIIYSQDLKYVKFIGVASFLGLISYILLSKTHRTQ